MKAVGINQFGSANVLEMVDVPRPKLSDDSVLIRVAVAGVNPADWQFRNGRFKNFMKAPFPFILGADVAGVVEQIGAKVTHFKPGDRVYAMLPLAIGGGYAEYAVTPESAVGMMPAGLSFSDAAAMPLTALTALQALRDKAKVGRGANLLLYGATGGVGTFAIQIAKVMGAHVTAVCSGRNADFVRSLGADDVRDYTQQDITSGTARYDVVFDAVNKFPFWKGLRILKRGGVLVSVNPVLGIIPVFTLAAKLRGRKVSSLLVKPSGADLQTLNHWIEAGQLRAEVESCYPLSEAADAQRQSETGHVRGKLVLIVDERLTSGQ